MESQHEYVVRKLNDKVFNILEVSKQSKVSRDTCMRIRSMDTKNPGTRTVQALYDYFKALAD